MSDDAALRQRIGNAVWMALMATVLVSTGYVVGYAEAATMPEDSSTGFMLGFTLTAAVAVPTIYVLTNGVPEPVRAFLPASDGGERR